jgi:hypothetical protein
MDAHLAAGPELDSAIALPHFVGIGAPRCGTSWVFTMLRLHPEIWMPWKELHFFDSTDSGTHSGYDIASRRFRLRRGWRPVLKRLAVGSVPGAAAITRRFFPLLALQSPGVAWCARYLAGQASLAWYEDLFREGAARSLLCGEITPAYFMLSRPGIRRFASALPEARVFLLLRDPIDWAWSTLCKDLREAGREPSVMTDAELMARCPVPNGRSRADFGQNLQRWIEHFPRDRLMIGVYDEILGEPVAYLERLCAHIGAGGLPEQVRRIAGRRVNSSARGLSMPPAVERHAALHFRAEAELVATLVGGPAERWVARIRSILQG